MQTYLVRFKSVPVGDLANSGRGIRHWNVLATADSHQAALDKVAAHITNAGVTSITALDAYVFTRDDCRGYPDLEKLFDRAQTDGIAAHSIAAKPAGRPADTATEVCTITTPA